MKVRIKAWNIIIEEIETLDYGYDKPWNEIPEEVQHEILAEMKNNLWYSASYTIEPTEDDTE